MDKKKLITFLLALTMILSLSVGASAAETTEARVPVTLTVVNTVAPISCTVPAALPVSLVDGYVSGQYLSNEAGGSGSGSGSTGGTVSGSGAATDIANFAMSFVGYSYVWGGTSPSTGFDCSGLMYYVLTQYGYSMKRVANDQMTQGTAVSRDSLQVGDLVFFGYGSYANHVGMYIGNGNFVHASTPSTGVRVNSLNETYYNTRYIGARRII